MSKITNYASQIYGQDQRGSSVNLFVPRSKFQFLVKIYHIGSTKALELSRISEIQMPAHSIKTQTLNQYNKKRTIQTGIDYTPISMSVYDTRDAEIERFLVGYNNHYYSSPMSDNYDIMKDDAISENFLSDESGKGFNLTNNRYYITKIEIIRTSSDEDKNIIEIYNPIITNIQADTLNYSESAPVQYRIDFTYEGYKTTTNGIELVKAPVTSVQAANAVQATNPTATATATTANDNDNDNGLNTRTTSGYKSNKSTDLQTGIVTTVTTTAPTTVTVFDEDGSKTTTTEPSMNIVEVFNPRTGLTETTTTDPAGNSTVKTTNSVQPGVSAQDVLAAKDAHAYNESIKLDPSFRM